MPGNRAQGPGARRRLQDVGWDQGLRLASASGRCGCRQRWTPRGVTQGLPLLGRCLEHAGLLTRREGGHGLA